jgi:DNA-binding beta-propeller fold protein YncE
MKRRGMRLAAWAAIVLLVAGAAGIAVRLHGRALGRAPLGGDFVYTATEKAGGAPAAGVAYREVRRIPSGLQRIAALAAGSNLVYAAGGAEVRVFAADGPARGQWQAGGEVRCLALADDGTVYLAVGSRIERYDGHGALLLRSEPLGTNVVITSLAAAGGNLFAADAGNRVVYRCDAAGRRMSVIGRRDPDRNLPGFVIPSPFFDVAVAPDGLLRVADTGRHRIEAFTAEGDLELWWGKFSTAADGFCGCCNPAHFALLPDGGFVTSEKGLRRVKVYDAAGAFRGVVLGTAVLGEGPEPCDVAADETGRIYVSGAEAGSIRVFERAAP